MPDCTFCNSRAVDRRARRRRAAALTAARRAFRVEHREPLKRPNKPDGEEYDGPDNRGLRRYGARRREDFAAASPRDRTDRRRLFLRRKTASSSTTSSGHLPASAALCKNAGLYRFPTFGTAGHVTAGNGSILPHRRTAAQISSPRRARTRRSDIALLLRFTP